MQLHVLGLVDDSHPPTADFFDDAIVRDGLANHWSGILGAGTGQVNEGGRGRLEPQLEIGWLLKNSSFPKNRFNISDQGCCF
jgi:hypothetical protein